MLSPASANIFSRTAIIFCILSSSAASKSSSGLSAAEELTSSSARSFSFLGKVILLDIKAIQFTGQKQGGVHGHLHRGQ